MAASTVTESTSQTATSPSATATATATAQKGHKGGLARMRFGRKHHHHQQQQQCAESVEGNAKATATATSQQRKSRLNSRRVKQVSWNNNSLFTNIDDVSTKNEATSDSYSSSLPSSSRQAQQERQSNDQRGDSVSRRHGDGRNQRRTRRKKSHSAPHLLSAFDDAKETAAAPASELQTSASSLPPYLDYSNVDGRTLWYTDTEIRRFIVDYEDDKDAQRYIRNQQIKNKMLQAMYKWKK